MHKKFFKVLTGTLLTAALCTAPLTAYAASAGEAAELARAMGLPEDLIQAGWNRYNENPELYPPEVIDSYMAALQGMNQTMVDQLITDNGYAPASPAPEDTPSAPTDAPQNSDQQSGGNNAGSEGSSGGSSTENGAGSSYGGGNASNNTNAPGGSSAEKPSGNGGTAGSGSTGGQNNSITLTLPDGSTFDRVSPKDFAAMTLDEKREYISSFTPEQQKVIISNLAPEDYKSLLKQLPVDDKAGIINDMADVTSQLGLTLSVEELTDENVTLSMKDENGKLVAMSSARDTVAATGYDRRGILGLAASLVTAGIVGMAIAVKRSFGRENEE